MMYIYIHFKRRTVSWSYGPLSDHHFPSLHEEGHLGRWRLGETWKADRTEATFGGRSGCGCIVRGVGMNERMDKHMNGWFAEFISWLIDSFIHWLIDCLIVCLIHSLIGWFSWLVQLFKDWLSHSSLHSLIHPIIHPSIYSSSNQSMNELINQLINQRINYPMNESTDQWIKKTRNQFFIDHQGDLHFLGDGFVESMFHCSWGRADPKFC